MSDTATFNRHVLNALPMQIAVLNSQGLIIAVNEAWKRFEYANGFQQDTATRVGTNYLQVCRQAADQAASIGHSALTGIEAVLAGEQAIFTLEYSHPAPDVAHWYLMQVTPLSTEQGGAVVIHFDITERKLTEEALRQSERHNRALLEAIPDAIARVHSDGTYLEIKAPKNFTSVRPPMELIGRKQAEVLPPELARQFLHYERLALATGTLQTFEYTVHVDDEVRTREARIVPAGPDEVIAILREITEVVQQRAQLRALSKRLAELQEAERKELARELHDQVGQNITALGLNLSVIRSRIAAQLPNDPLLQSSMADALLLLEQTTEVIRDVLTNLRPPMLDDFGLLAALRWYGERLATRSALRLTVEGTEPQPALAETVANALFRIAQEALLNVVKHAQATHVIIRMKSTQTQIEVSVIDNGRGFDLESLRQPGKAPSWGLLNMQERAQAVDGHCTIAAQRGAGTTITVEVPL